MESNGVSLADNVPRIVDKTGLAGTYEFTLEFAGITIFPASLVALAPPAADGPAVAPDPGEIGPTIFNAAQAQLGLKLQKVKSVPVDMLVVDRIDKVPTGN